MRPGDCQSALQTALLGAAAAPPRAMPPPRPNRPPAAEQCPAGPCSFTHRPQGRSLLSPQDGGAAPHLPPPPPDRPRARCPGLRGAGRGPLCTSGGRVGGFFIFGGGERAVSRGCPPPQGTRQSPNAPPGPPPPPLRGQAVPPSRCPRGAPPRPVPLRPRGAPTRAGLPGGGGGSAPPLPHWFAAEPVTAAAPRLAPAAGAPPGRPPPRPPCAERRGPGTGTALRSAPPRTAPHRSARSGGRAGRAGPSRAEPGGGTGPQLRTAPSSTEQHRAAPRRLRGCERRLRRQRRRSAPAARPGRC